LENQKKKGKVLRFADRHPFCLERFASCPICIDRCFKKMHVFRKDKDTCQCGKYPSFGDLKEKAK
jgi:hypothetical protein